MMAVDGLNSEVPSGHLGISSRTQFSGRLEIRSTDRQEWNLYLYMGRLIWASGGTHPQRRWRRYLAQYCPQINLDQINLRESDEIYCPDYQLLSVLVRRQMVTVEQAISIVRSVIGEVLFDVVQREETGTLTFSPNQKNALDSSLTVINTELALQETQQVWQSWRSLGLADYSPDLAPVLRREAELQQQTSEKVYKTLVSMLNGKRTLRDLASLLKQDLLVLTRSLLPYLHKGLIGLIQISDLPPPIPAAPAFNQTANNPPFPSPSPSAPLIACVDDSDRARQELENILSRAGCRFLGIKDSVQALPKLLEHRPDLIFLDLVMPIANGYEICAQIRRVSLFKNTPVVILTSNDGIVDRVRAKVVGSSDFLGKPVEVKKVMEILRKHLPVPLQSKLLFPA